MKLNDLYPSRYLKAEDIKGKDRTLTIGRDSWSSLITARNF